MRIVELPDNVSVNIKESPKELPINRYADFQKYLIQAAGIGSTMGHVEEHFNKLHKLIAAGKTQEAAREAFNLHNNFHLMLNKIDIDSIAFACLVDSITYIDDPQKPKEKRVEKVTDYSETGLVNLCKTLGELGLERHRVTDIISEVKKKSIQI